MEIAGSTGNRLLDALVAERPALRPALERIAPRVGAEIYCEGDPVSHLYFPTQGAVSVVVHLATGAIGDVITVGNEGLVGLPAWLGMERSLETVVQQRPGEIVRVPARELHRQATASRRIRDLLHHFMGFALRCGSQTAVCNACHTAEQRVCRWLLGAADRAGERTVEMSQSALADLLGLRRQTVGAVAVRLQRERLITYRRGDIRLVERHGLELRACECYAALRDAYQRVIEPHVRTMLGPEPREPGRRRA